LLRILLLLLLLCFAAGLTAAMRSEEALKA
jgi:hypothetical protein